VSLSKLLPKLDNAGRRLILSEVLGEPVSIRLAKQRQLQLQQQAKQGTPPKTSSSPLASSSDHQKVESTRKEQ
jgi:hypothetical protein